MRTRVIPILKRVEVGDYPSKIGRIYGWSRQHVFYYIRKLEKAGLIRREKRSSAVFYELTARSKELLRRCEGLVYGSGVYRLHKCQVRYPVLAEGLLPKDFKRIEMQNWTALLGLEHGVKVRRTTRSWIVHVETLYGKSPAELGVLAKGLANRVAASLCLKYGCRLGEGRFCRGYEIAVDHPVAKLLSRYFTVTIPRRKMDHSPCRSGLQEATTSGIWLGRSANDGTKNGNSEREKMELSIDLSNLQAEFLELRQSIVGTPFPMIGL